MKRTIIPLLVFLLLVILASTAAEGYTDSTMRLLRYEGGVEILNTEGVPRLAAEDALLESGESIRIGEAGIATVGMDDTKTVIIDANTTVQLIKESGCMCLKLQEGAVFVDVSKKLGEKESFHIETSFMTAGIRGTIVYATDRERDEERGRITSFGVLEGTGQIDFTDSSGARREISVPAGHKASIPDDSQGRPEAPRLNPVVTKLTPDDINPFIQTAINEEQSRKQRAEPVVETLQDKEEENHEDDYPYPRDGDWSYPEDVRLISQSASKFYDGKELTASSDVLVTGLPADFTAEATASGSRTEVGSCANEISQYHIYNSRNEDVTGHFFISLVEGTLTVQKLPVVAWTGSAEKVYDGTPLTCDEAGIRTVAGKSPDQPEWRNSSISGVTAGGSSVIYATSGVMELCATNIFSGDTDTITLNTGERLTITVSETDGVKDLVYNVEKLPVSELPEEVLRLYADNPELRKQACMDAGWDLNELEEVIATLKTDDLQTVSQSGLQVREEQQDRLILDRADIRISIDADSVQNNSQPLGKQEAQYMPVALPEKVVVTPTGSQTEVGESKNTYTIDWGTNNPENYTVSSDPGTLTVTPLNLEVNLGGGTVVYNGNAGGFAPYIRYRNGVHDGETVYGNRSSGQHEYVFTLFTGDTITVHVSGRGTEPGTYSLTGAVTSSTANPGCIDVVFSGTALTIEPVPLRIATGSASKAYDGAPLTSSDVDVQGLLDGDTVSVTATGSQTEIGSGSNTYTIDWGTTNPSHYAVQETLGVLEVTAPETKRAVTVTVTGASETQEYTGEEFRVSGYTLSFSDPAYTAEDFTFSGSGVAAGTVPGTYPMGLSSAQFTNTNSGFDVTFAVTDGSLTITKCPVTVTITGGKETKVYNGAVQEASGWSIASSNPAFPEEPGDITFTGSGVAQGKNAGTYMMGLEAADFANSNDMYDVTFEVTDGSLTISRATLTISTGDETSVYDGTSLPKKTDPPVVTGFVGNDGDFASVEPLSDQLTDAGSAPNRYSITWTDDTVAANYTISEDLGTLTVNPAAVIITLGSYNCVYNGDPVLPDGMNAQYGNGDPVSGLDIDYEEGILLTSFKLLGGEVLQVTCSGFSDAGSYTYAPTCAITGGNAANYSVSFQNTGITISPSQVQIQASGTFTYDGSPHSGTLDTYSEGAYSEGAAGGTVTDSKIWEVVGPGGAVITVTLPEYTDAGVYTFTPSWVLSSGTPGNYIIEAVSSELTIQPLSIDAKVAPPSIVFKNGAHAGETISFPVSETIENGWTGSVTLFTGDTITMTITKTLAADVMTTSCECSFNQNGSNYEVSYATLTEE